MVKSTNAYDIKVQPRETLTLSGLVRKNRQVEFVNAEKTEWSSTRIRVCPGIVSKSTCLNIQHTCKGIAHRAKSDLCELHDVKVLRHINPINLDIKKAQLNQQCVSVKGKEAPPEGMILAMLAYQKRNHN